MLKRKALEKIKHWKQTKTRQALLVSGVRQAGKTFLIRRFARENYENVVEINLIENPGAAEGFDAAHSASALFTVITAFAEEPLVPGKTVIFIDEVQECKEAVTAVKFLVDEYGGDYDFILSGSLLGVELHNIRSAPVGYLTIAQMFPLDFEEFCWARGVSELAIDEARRAFEGLRPVDASIDARLTNAFHEYLVVGGMPDAVQAFAVSKNLQDVRSIQNDIVNLYRYDISKYAGKRARTVRRVFDLIPAELNTQGKRFALAHIEDKAGRFSKYENDFAWLVDAGVALPAYNVDEPSYPLELAADSSFFKLFLSDVGLLTCMCGMDIVRDLASGRTDVNFGALYENYVAQEFAAHGLCHPTPSFHLFFFRNKKVGELDFLYEKDARVVPVEVKSGKSYKRHSALTRALATPNYGIESAYVLHEGNIEADGKTVYLPMYMTMFL